MPALERSSTSPVPNQWSTPDKTSLSSPHASQSLEAFSASGTIPLSPLSPHQQRLLTRPHSPSSYNTAVRHVVSPTPFNSTAELHPSTHPATATPLTRPSTSPASLSSPTTSDFSLAVELREAHQQLLIQKHAIAAALGAELTALKEERVRERRQHAVVMRRMEEEVRRLEERARSVELDNERIRAELVKEREQAGQQRGTSKQQPLHASRAHDEAAEEAELDGCDESEAESESEAAAPVFHSQPPSSRPSITCPLPTRQSNLTPATHSDDDVSIRQMSDVIQQLSQQIAAIRLQSAQPKRDERRQSAAVSRAEAVVYGPGRVWREYEPLVFSGVQPIVFHRTGHYTHYDVNEWGRGH